MNDLSSFKKKYTECLFKNCSDLPHLSSLKLCLEAAERMVESVIKEADPVDWLKYNASMKEAAKFFGVTSSKVFRETLKKLGESK